MNKNGIIISIFFAALALLFQIILLINVIEKRNIENRFETKYEIIKNMSVVVDSDTLKVIGKSIDEESIFLSNGKVIHIDSVANYFSVK